MLQDFTSILNNIFNYLIDLYSNVSILINDIISTLQSYDKFYYLFISLLLLISIFSAIKIWRS